MVRERPTSFIEKKKKKKKTPKKKKKKKHPERMKIVPYKFKK